MSLFTNKNRGVAPHIRFPEILHWQEGDEIEARNANAKGIISKIRALELGKLNLNYFYKSITDSGYIIVEEVETKELHKIEFSNFIRNATNLSLRRRLINDEISDSNEYMELMSEFQKAYHELESTDQKKLES